MECLLNIISSCHNNFIFRPHLFQLNYRLKPKPTLLLLPRWTIARSGGQQPSLTFVSVRHLVDQYIFNMIYVSIFFFLFKFCADFIITLKQFEREKLLKSVRKARKKRWESSGIFCPSLYGNECKTCIGVRMTLTWIA